MANNEEERKLTTKINTLRFSKEYQNPEVTPEGYGSFMPQPNTLEALLSRAKTLRVNADMMNSKESIQTYLESLYCYLEMLEQDYRTEMKVDFLNQSRSVMKLIDHIIEKCKKYDSTKVESALNWALFNLRFIKLTTETQLFSKSPDSQIYGYMLETLKYLESYKSANLGTTIEIVDVFNLAAGIKKRL